MRLSASAANAEHHRRNREWPREHGQSAKRDREWFLREVTPKLDAFSLVEIARATGLLLAVCSRFRAGTRAPPPRRWDAFVALIGDDGVLASRLWVAGTEPSVPELDERGVEELGKDIAQGGPFMRQLFVASIAVIVLLASALQSSARSTNPSTQSVPADVAVMSAVPATLQQQVAGLWTQVALLQSQVRTSQSLYGGHVSGSGPLSPFDKP